MAATKTTKRRTAALKKRKYTRSDEKGTGEEGYAMFGRKGTALTGAWLDLAKAYGGIKTLASTIGVTPVTVYRWAVKGFPVRGPSRAIVVVLAVAKGLPPPPMAN